MLAVQTATKVKFHFGLEVADLGRAVKFYRLLFGSAPAKSQPAYAEFELNDPPLVLALKPGSRSGGGALNHVGFRVPDSAALVKIQHRLEAGGIPTQREEGVECCYARQTKFWVPDADRNLWEIYVLEKDIEHSGFGGDNPASIPASDNFAELHSLQIRVSRPSESQPGEELHSVVYKGPLARVVDDEGHVYPRGLRVRVPESTCSMLRQAGLKDAFAFLS